MMETLFYLLGWHALADYVFQPEYMAKYKHPDALIPSADGSWWWWMTAHSLINGLGVGLLTTWHLGVAETVVHWLTDYSKCRGWITSHQDQGLHLFSKLWYAWLA